MGLNVLFVDDESEILFWYKSIFEIAFPEANFLSASDGQKALKCCET